MGLEDRDYMRERRDADTKVLQFRPAPKRTSVLTIALYVLTTFFLLYRAALWWQDKQLQERMRASVPVAAPIEGPRNEEPARTFTSKAPHALPAQPNQGPAPGTVSKCVVNGKVTYSDAACPQDAVVSSLKLPPAAPVDVRQQAVAVSAPPAASQQSGMAPEAQPTLHAPTQAAPAKTAECRYLDDLVKQIDAQALQPLTLQQQDLLRTDRKKARDRQFFLGC